MLCNWMRRRRARRVAMREPQKLRLEALDERESPSVLSLSSGSGALLERPASAPRGLSAEERWVPASPHADWGAFPRTEVENTDRHSTPQIDSVLPRLMDFQAVELLQLPAGGGSSITETWRPSIVGFHGTEEEDGWWTFSGRVEADSPGGLLVVLGGIPTLVEKTAEVNEDGTFSIRVRLGDCEGGLATAQTADWDGVLSEIVEDYVHRTGCSE